MSKHKMVNGQLLQMNKPYSQLKNKQKEKISNWMYEAYKKQMAEKLSDEEALQIVYDKIPITVSEADMDDYICITDMAAAKSENSRAADVVRNWLRNRSTLEFLSTWEEIYNPDFKVFESEHFKRQAGLVVFTPSVSEWVDKTGAIGLFVRKGRYGGTFAHKDIAFEFASAISPVFKLYLIKEFERLKEQENDLKKIEWEDMTSSMIRRKPLKPRWMSGTAGF